MTDCGERLGVGSRREVFVYLPDPTKVVKVMKSSAKKKGKRSNEREYENYMLLRSLYSEWMSPCWLDGDRLIMWRTVPIQDDSQRPLAWPSCFKDDGYDNWGFLGDRVVLHDYHLIGQIEPGKMRHRV